jgi:hypothetical protein
VARRNDSRRNAGFHAGARTRQSLGRMAGRVQDDNQVEWGSTRCHPLRGLVWSGTLNLGLVRTSLRPRLHAVTRFAGGGPCGILFRPTDFTDSTDEGWVWGRVTIRNGGESYLGRVFGVLFERIIGDYRGGV